MTHIEVINPLNDSYIGHSTKKRLSFIYKMIISKEIQSLAISELNHLSFREYNFVSHSSSEINDNILSRSFTKVSGGDKEFIDNTVINLCNNFFSDDVLSYYRIEIKSLFDFKFKVMLKPRSF